MKMSDVEWDKIPVSDEAPKAQFIRESIEYRLANQDRVAKWLEKRKGE